VSAGDIARLMEVRRLPVVVRGVPRGDDAKRCVDAGAQGVIVSNKGGRQLDRVLPPALALPEVALTVGESVEVYVDGGTRCGADVLTALALGARAVFVGRPVLWALSVGGAGAVADLMTELQRDFTETLTLAGCDALAAASPDLLRIPS
jgi:4-hydroxymandelate oxidase